MKTIETIEVTFGDVSKDYLIDIGENITYRLSEYIQNNCLCQRLLIITDNTVAAYYLDDLQQQLSSLNIEIFVHRIIPGEESKSLNVVSQIYSKLAKNFFSRSDLIITFGGGVVGDLGGYVAATFKRGIPFIQIPTTLLSQVDSSVGGKVAVNIIEGKNLIGAFYQPKYVLIDTSYLSTLQVSQWKDGIGEIIKYAFIGSESLYQFLKEYSLETIKNRIANVISSCCKIKRDVVTTDEFDKGLRMTLNFGHTLGHAIEKFYGYGVISHGQAVAMGMFLIMRQVEINDCLETTMSDEIKDMLIQYDLFREDVLNNYPDYCNDILNDKKVFEDKLNIIVVDKIGKSRIYPLSLSQAKLLLNRKIT